VTIIHSIASSIPSSYPASHYPRITSIFGGPVAIEVPAEALGPQKSMVFGLIVITLGIRLQAFPAGLQINEGHRRRSCLKL
jgi:hypothetical protein